MEQTTLRRKLSPLLKKVNKPGRYIGGEYNQIIKNDDLTDVRFAFAFPDLYEIGMSYVGMQILYNLLNHTEGVACERVFAPAGDMEAAMRKEGIPLFSLETCRDVRDFSILGFTLQYEMSYTNILNMLDLAGIPLLAEERTEDDPLVVGGGPCAYNPEPLAAFFDLFLIGDGELLLPAICRLRRETNSREEFLRAACRLDGVYVPSFYRVRYHEDGRIAGFEKLYDEAPDRVLRAFVQDLDKAPYPEKPLVPLIEVAQDRAVVETFRGCTRGCRFCQAGMIYRPVREREPETVQHLAAAQLANTGQEELSLLSLSTSDYSRFQSMTTSLIDMCSREDVSLSLPSLRLDSFNVEVLHRIQQYKKSGLTFAPEAGTQRMRDVINKNITEEDIFGAVRQAIRLGWKKIKLYFMMGLPGETLDDLAGIAEIAQKIMEISREENGPGKGRFTLNISVSNFVPKPFTPFQWVGQDEDFYEKHDFLRKKLKIKGVQFNYHDSPVSTLEAVFARGDRRTADLLLAAYEAGCRFDSWSEDFRWDKWQEAMARSGIDPAFYATRQRDPSEILPWDLIDCGVSKAYLLREYEKSQQGATTRDCRSGCTGCGINRHVVCPLDGTMLQMQKKRKIPMANFEICFSKEGDIKYISHLDVMRMFRRAFKRAGLDLVYSNGFNPHPKLSIAAPLPLGFTSTDEWMDVETKEDFRADNLKQALQQEMPVGITILEVRAKELQPNKANPMLAARVTAAKYMIAADLPEQTLAKIQQDTAEQFLAQEHIFVEKRQKKKKTMQKVDIRNKIRSLLLHCVDDKLFLSTLLSTGSASNLNPSLLLHAFLAWLDPGTEPLDVEIMRRKLYFDA